MKPLSIDKFLGVINTGSEESLPLGALSIADNVLINNYHDAQRRPGFEQILSASDITSSYGLSDHSALFLVEGDTLFKFNGESAIALVSGLSSTRYVWTEESPRLIFMMGDNTYIAISDGQNILNIFIPKLTELNTQIGSGNIPAGTALVAAQYYTQQGLYGPMSDPVEVSSDTPFSILVTAQSIGDLKVRIVAFLQDESVWTIVGDTSNFAVIDSVNNSGGIIDGRYFDVISPPTIGVLAMTYYAGRVVIAVDSGDETDILFSAPGAYHLFGDYFTLPDRVTDMESVNGRLLITGQSGIYSYSSEKILSKLADYGTPTGKPIVKLPDNGCYIWTFRGLCGYPEFKNLTEDIVSLPSGNSCASSLFEFGGSKYLLNCNDGEGVSFNSS